MRDDVDYLEERQRCAAVRAARYQQSLQRYHRHHIRVQSLKVGDLVLQCAQAREGKNKLSPMWEDPFIVTGVSRQGSFRLATEDGQPLLNVWNIKHLHKFYP